jgi:hypothetical protein
MKALSFNERMILMGFRNDFGFGRLKSKPTYALILNMLVFSVFNYVIKDKC